MECFVFTHKRVGGGWGKKLGNHNRFYSLIKHYRVLLLYSKTHKKIFKKFIQTAKKWKWWIPKPFYQPNFRSLSFQSTKPMKKNSIHSIGNIKILSKYYPNLLHFVISHYYIVIQTHGNYGKNPLSSWEYWNPL